MYTITLANGEKISNLEKNGDNFISKKHIDESLFTGNLYEMTVNDGETDTVYHNVELVQQIQYSDGRWYLVFRELSDYEIREVELDSKIEYLAMMAGIDMEV